MAQLAPTIRSCRAQRHAERIAYNTLPVVTTKHNKPERVSVHAPCQFSGMAWHVFITFTNGRGLGLPVPTGKRSMAHGVAKRLRELLSQ